MKRIESFANKDCPEEFWDSFRNEKYRSGVKTSARTEPFRKYYFISISCYDGLRVYPRTNTERDIALYMYKNNSILLSFGNLSEFFSIKQ